MEFNKNELLHLLNEIINSYEELRESAKLGVYKKSGFGSRALIRQRIIMLKMRLSEIIADMYK